MKYFKITDLTSGTDTFISSPLPNETATHVAMSAHLDPDKKYTVEEVSYDEFCQGLEKFYTDVED